VKAWIDSPSRASGGVVIKTWSETEDAGRQAIFHLRLDDVRL
jgi:hypothetical protein